MRRRVHLAVFLLLLLLVACESKNQSVTLGGATMGTSWSVVLPSPPGHVLLEALQRAIESELVRINQLMSTYQPDSDLSRFNAYASTSPMQLHPEILLVLDASIQVSAATQGAYDVTLGSIIDLWGFGAGRESAAMPTVDQLKSAAKAIGYDRLQQNGQMLSKPHPDTQIDLSSLAKGYAVDRIGVIIERAGITDYLAEIGGEIKTRGGASNSEQWLLGVENPNGEAAFGVAVNDAHIASSGSYRNFREIDGVRVSHLIDGRTYRPITHSTVAATVLHRNTMLADAWATALMVVKPSKAKKLVQEQGIDAQLTIKSGDGFEIWQTPGFAALLAD